MMAVGARGVVSVLANVAPKETQALCDLFKKGDLKKARALHLKLFPLIKALFVETNPIPVKAALGMMGLCRPEPRLPLTPLSDAARPALRKALKNAGLV
jgi:4-hydroxy-tetrahydrodipicolinate synthase